MKVEIWSDVMCPFCYIGKRKFEKALLEFEGMKNVSIEWKSFQLNPGMVTDAKKTIESYLVEAKGISFEQAQMMNDRVSKLAKEVGLNFQLDKAILANSFNAHRLTHFAKSAGKQQEAEESLFQAYFVEGKNISDIDTLVQLGTAIGLEPKELLASLESDAYSNDVKKDQQEAQELGISGVPFYVFNRKFAVSGAQESAVFLNALIQASETD